MATIRPFEGYLVNPERAALVASPAYDALTPEQRHAYAETHSTNFLNVMRSREEYPRSQRPSLDVLLARNKARLEEMIRAGDFVREPRPSLYLYRLSVAGHVQTGVVAEIPVAEFEQGLVKKHEHTQEGKEDDLTAYQRVVRASSSPICLAYAGQPEIDALVAELTSAPPVIDFVAEDGVAQSVWLVDDPSTIHRLQAQFSRVPSTYLTDGHHRAASASRFRASERAANPNHTGEEAYNFLLVALFPDRQLRILEYNRMVQGTNGLSHSELLAAVEERFEVEPLGSAPASSPKPRRRGEITMLLGGEWYRVTIRAGAVLVASDDPVRSLDVTILQDELLGPVLGVGDPRTDPRIDYLSGAFGLQDLARHCRDHDSIGFAVYPTAIEDLMAVADAGAVMPPKSTWFDPKLRSGLFLRIR